MKNSISTPEVTEVSKSKFISVSFFKNAAYRGGFELNIIVEQFNLRIAKHQFAFWRNYNSVFNFTY
jgi:hypothetical protein